MRDSQDLDSLDLDQLDLDQLDLDSLDLDQLASVTGGRITNDGADPELIDAVTGVGAQLGSVSSALVEVQGQFFQQMFPMLLQVIAQRRGGGAAAGGEASGGADPAGGMLGGLL